MTSTVLAQKLVSVKLSKLEYERTRCLKVSTMEKSLKVINELKKIIDMQEINKICRLCLRLGTKCIFDNKNDFDFVHNIKDILGIEVNENDGKPRHICDTCEGTLRDAERLKQTAETTQWRLQQELDMVTNPSSNFDVDEPSNSHGGSFVEKRGKIERQWSCKKCRRTFATQAEFTQHEKQPSCRPQNCFICETCGMELKTMTRLKRHSGELRHPCALCPYRARTAYALRVHGRVHSGRRPLHCALCPAAFPSASNLASHRRTHRPPALRCPAYPACRRTFRFKQVLKNHFASQHTTAKPHVCDTCGKAFSTRKMICRHERRVHNRPKMKSGILPTYLRQQEEVRT